ncbi:PH domain-containing protein [Nisaea acidiphila]|uniref:PH domain-containing protein n=1 Tax=Nisaea acidiphila TaxID=1862145 RepID=A0A9J7ANN4_9PROT|nr:PH domain-containing protein [Nisaea acidiphila]UUX48807.1 PH domain-containing protein [Nisaea acidiphila]
MAITKYAKAQLVSGENIMAAARIHWIVFLRPLPFLAFGSLFVLASIGIKAAPDPDKVDPGAILGFAGGAMILVALFVGISSFIAWACTELVLTNRRVIAKFGFIRRKAVEMDMRRVEGINLDQSILGRILDYGSIEVRGTGGGISPIPGIASPGRFKKVLDQRVSEVVDGAVMSTSD